ncbi:lachrymatory-factor synthase-like [Amaranthus tricolor]|uniref:lachrymatory-factor synthase-like n=1 Tax=Amaranthus tricolor TaxID=29722 RepID=UPI0025840F53|nr:lachrymatory-factor synthase-like [Amaranthus tricolor]
MAEQYPPKWEGETTVEIKTLTPQQVWALISDFGSLDKVLPHLDKCSIVEGTPGEPGLTRCCESSLFSGGTQVQYAYEKLVKIDPSEMSLSYEITENNAGFKYYFSTMKLFPINGGDDGNIGTKFVWSFVCDPLDGFTQQVFCEAIQGLAQGMVKKLEGNAS